MKHKDLPRVRPGHSTSLPARSGTGFARRAEAGSERETGAITGPLRNELSELKRRLANTGFKSDIEIARSYKPPFSPEQKMELLVVKGADACIRDGIFTNADAGLISQKLRELLEPHATATRRQKDAGN